MKINRKPCGQTQQRRAKSRCYIDGCAKWRSDECTDCTETCRMLARMRASGERYEPITRRHP